MLPCKRLIYPDLSLNLVIFRVKDPSVGFLYCTPADPAGCALPDVPVHETGLVEVRPRLTGLACATLGGSYPI